MRVADFHDFVHPAGVAVEVHGDTEGRVLLVFEHGRKRRRAHVVRFGVDVAEHGDEPVRRKRHDAGDVGIGRRDYLTRSLFRDGKAPYPDRVGPGADAEGVAHSDVSGKCLLEAFHFTAEDELATAGHLVEDSLKMVLERRVF